MIYKAVIFQKFLFLLYRGTNFIVEFTSRVNWEFPEFGFVTTINLDTNSKENYPSGQTISKCESCHYGVIISLTVLPQDQR